MDKEILADAEALGLKKKPTPPKDISIFSLNVDKLAIELSTYRSDELLHQFERCFTALSDYKPESNSPESIHVMEIARVFKEEIYLRIDRGNNYALEEFAKIMQFKMKQSKHSNAEFYCNYLLRFYSYAIQIMQIRNFNEKHIERMYK